MNDQGTRSRVTKRKSLSAFSAEIKYIQVIRPLRKKDIRITFNTKDCCWVLHGESAGNFKSIQKSCS